MDLKHHDSLVREKMGRSSSEMAKFLEKFNHKTGCRGEARHWGDGDGAEKNFGGAVATKI